MDALDLAGGWGSPAAAVGVVGAAGVLAVRGDPGRRGRWASVTKPVTALAALVAAEQGVIDLDDPAGPPGATVAHLLAHASGLAFDDARVLAPPGRRRIYSNTGYELLGDHLAARSGMAFEPWLTHAVLAPLGLSGTTLEGSPAAGLVGPLTDLLHVAGELRAPTLVSAATFARMTAVAFPGLAGVLPGIGRFDSLDWGLGVEVRGDKRPHWMPGTAHPTTFGHFGASGSFVWVDPTVGVACVALTGRDFGAWAPAAWSTLGDAVLAEVATRAPDRQP